MPILPQQQPRPIAPQVQFENIPEALKPFKQWVLWRFTWKPKNSKWDKPPFQIDGKSASHSDPSTWGSYDDAVSAYLDGGFDGIGFVLTEQDQFVGLDFDDCSLETVKPFFVSSYAEVSPSGKGYRQIAVGNKPEGRSRTSKLEGFKSVEMYGTERYLTITGQKLEEYPADVVADQPGIDRVYKKVFSQEPKTPTDISDAAVLRKARKESAFAARFDRGEITDHSEDDFAACCVLFKHGADLEQADRLFRNSALMRPKWDTPHHGDGSTYGQKTLERARDAAQTPLAWPSPVDPFAENPAPPFPLDTLPQAFQTFAKERATQSGFDAGGYGFALLVMAGNICDHRTTLSVGPFSLHPHIWGGLVGPSGCGKSPILTAASKPALSIDAELVKASRREYANWAEHERMSRKDKISPPPRPPWLQRHATDATTEAMGKLAADNPEGIYSVQHEFTELIGRMDAYAGKDGGKDRGVFIRGFDGGAAVINRSGREPLVIDHFSIGIMAGIQPEVLAEKFRKSGAGADGLYQRFLVYCLPPATEVDYLASVGTFTDANLNTLFERLKPTQGDAPQHYRLAPEASMEMQAYHNRMRTLAQRTSATRFAEHLDKFPGLLGRVSLALHLMHSEATSEPLRDVVSVETLRDGIRIMACLYRHSEAVYRILDKDAGQASALMKSAAEAILSKGWDRFMRGDLTRDATYWQSADSRDAEGAIDLLIELGWIVDVTPTAQAGKRGRRSTGAFMVNPQVHDIYKAQAQRIKDARSERYQALKKISEGI